MLGSNQSGVRAHNERLVLSILRRDGPMAKAQIARLTGLSAQTVSVIVRALEEDGMLLRDAPRRGKVGQPSVPMRIDPDGAFFFGLTVGRRYADLVLVDMAGRIRARDRQTYDYPDYDRVVAFARSGVAAIKEDLSADRVRRISGLGVAMPFQLWDWAETLGVSQEDLAPWRHRDIGADLTRHLDLAVAVQNDASAACGAELVFGTIPDLPQAFLHIYIAFFVGGGLVLDGRLFTGVTGNACALGSMPVPLEAGRMGQLVDIASLIRLSQAVVAAGKDPAPLWHFPLEWDYAAPEVEAWIETMAPALAHAIVSTAAVIDIETVVIDGHLPPDIRTRITAAVNRSLDGCEFAGLARPDLREGTVGPDARSLGAASLPLAARFIH